MGFASRTGLLAGAAVALALTGAQAALAATTVSGAGDSSSPLVIDPRTSPSDALQLRLNVGSPAPVAFVERMPVTKTIQDVSLGDFQSDPGDCANPMQLYLMVREHPAGDADQATQIAYAPAQPTVPDSAGVMTWRLDQPVTLQQGRGYSFAIMSTDPASCHFLYQTTWAHNGAQVEGGTNQCATGVRFGENDSVLLKRGWHTQGVSDGVYGPNGCAGSKWDPGLSEGWLVSIPSGDAWDVATAAIAQGLPVPPPPPDSCTVNDNHLHPDYGAEQLHYYPVNYPPGPVSYDYYLCRWTQFAPPGHEIPDGWYYGLPWRTERGGAPRDVYVKLGKDTTPAPVKFAPILRFDTSEKWRPLNVNAFFAEGVHKVCMAKPPATRDTAKQAFYFDSQPVFGGSTHFFDSVTSCAPVSDPAQLMNPPWNSSQAWIQVAGKGLLASSYHSTDPSCLQGGLLDCGTAPRSAIYYHESTRASGDPYEYLDYWFFYRYNDGPTLPGGTPIDKHQADWEGVTVGVTSRGASTFDFAAFAEHKNVYKYLRQNLRCDGGGPGSCGTEANKTGQRVDVFVTNGGHASYPEPCHATVILGYNLTCFQTDASFPYLEAGGWDGAKRWEAADDPMAVIPFPESTWVKWPGNWGVDETVLTPGNQPRFKSPGTPSPTCSAGDGSPPNPAGTVTVCAARHRPASCDPWFGQSISVMVCDPRRLARSVVRHRLGRKGAVRIVFTKRRVSSASAPGVAQAMGSVVTPRDRTSIRGLVPAGASVLVRGFAGSSVVVARFSLHRAVRNPSIQVSGSRLRPRVRLVASRVRLKPTSARLFRIARR